MVEALQLAWYERSLGIRLTGFLVGALVTVCTTAVAYRSSSLTGMFAASVAAGIFIWMLTTARTHLALAVLMIYLGCADGVVKLMTNSSSATLGRDVLLYAIVIGLLVKRMLRKEPFVAPPLTGWIVAFLGVIAIQLFNPSDVSISHALASTRPHLEFVPLFFLGYSVMRSRKRLKGFLVLLIAIAAINGLVGVVQFGLSPSQFASWGPGYAARINGTGGVSGREFRDSSGQARTRPFGLGSDIGFGGSVGVLAGPAALMLLSLGGDRRLKILAGALAIGVVLAVVTSQARTAIIGSVVAIIAYTLLATSSRRVFRVLMGLALGLTVAYGAISVLSAHTNSSLFSRYKSIAPSKVFSTAYTYRSGTAAAIPQYMRKFPLGAGIGTAGPASLSAGGRGSAGLDAESEPTYLLIELGIPGLIVFLGFQVRLLAVSGKIRRVRDLELRLLLAALAGPLFALVVSDWVGITSATTPDSPYLWFAGGTLTYWLIGAQKSSGHGARTG